MPEPESNSVMILLGICVGLLVLVLLLIFRVSARISQVESLLVRNLSRPETGDDAPSVAETSPGGAFEEFLNEDAQRRNLTKSEQFTAYRQWRQEKGMNWSKS